MKKILLCMVMSVSFFGYGQINLPDTSYTLGTNEIVLLNNYNRITIDTVKCIMLVCDTSTLPNNLDIRQGSLKNSFCFWMYGYLENTRSGSMLWENYRHSYRYLDENKKPLNKNIIVWLSKSL